MGTSAQTPDEAFNPLMEDLEFGCSACHADETDAKFREVPQTDEQVAAANHIHQLLQEFEGQRAVRVDAPQGNALAGQELAENLCASCHALVPNQISPNEAAPNFNSMVIAYPPSHLAEGFAEGIVVGTDSHIAMPQFQLEPEQIDDLIAYLETVLVYAYPPAKDGPRVYREQNVED
ncbi:c-type cytochrome [Candidatus Phaeomarinobacter ectocarpi]|uniref:c-type cytochrome n=1 Tax=Candidatus Phaeomarinibacter ectocarpi TaxID=1458461 RepID=UPI0006973E9E|nr:cytochrome c [Candidatus Phaeomarinobacter ectocarpi]